MNDNEEKASVAIAEEAAERFVANDEGALAAHDAEALAAWLKASPAHVGEFLGVSGIARDLAELKADPDYSLDAVLELARNEDDKVRDFRPLALTASRNLHSRRWQGAAAALAACAVLSLGVYLKWQPKPGHPMSLSNVTAALQLKTGHGEQLTRRLADSSVLHLNVDSAATIQYGSSERLVSLIAGEAGFEVAHDSKRPFRVTAGSAQVVAVGTQFDVRLEPEATVITVIEGRVAVGQVSNDEKPSQFVELAANQQLRVIAGEWPPIRHDVDAQSVSAWLHRQISFDHEPLERVAAEYNRYAPKPIEIATPALKTLRITGVFAADDPEEFIAFLRSLKGVRVEVGAKRILVSAEQ